MGTLTELRVPIVRRAAGKFRGRNYTVSLLPGDILELRQRWSRKVYRVPLAQVFEHVMNTEKPLDLDSNEEGNEP